MVKAVGWICLTQPIVVIFRSMRLIHLILLSHLWTFCTKMFHSLYIDDMYYVLPYW